MEQLIKNILEWADNKNLLKEENAPTQYLKVVEEVGELCSAYLKNKPVELKDSVGDVFVTLIILAKQREEDINLKKILIFKNDYNSYDNISTQVKWLLDSVWNNQNLSLGRLFIVCEILNLDPKDCLQAAWNEIKDRKGKTVNGSFIKE